MTYDPLYTYGTYEYRDFIADLQKRLADAERERDKFSQCGSEIVDEIVRERAGRDEAEKLLKRLQDELDWDQAKRMVVLDRDIVVYFAKEK